MEIKIKMKTLQFILRMRQSAAGLLTVAAMALGALGTPQIAAADFDDGNGAGHCVGWSEDGSCQIWVGCPGPSVGMPHFPGYCAY